MIEEYRNTELVSRLVKNIGRISKTPIRLMEVCGTHTVSIFRNGIRSLLPETISLISGPGCPVCVTSQREIDIFIELAKLDNVTIATFGDLIKVPGTRSSLQKERSEGRDIRIVYSPIDALQIAVAHPDRTIVFLGVGFETTAPTIAASILTAAERNIQNFCVCSAHKLVPPALFALMNTPDVRIDGFILPGHVSVIIGTNAYVPFFQKHRIPCSIAGFDAGDIFQAIYALVEQIENGSPILHNAYPRAVSDQGNRKAVDMMNQVFDVRDAMWRGLGTIPNSGLIIRESFSKFNALRRFNITVPESEAPKGCCCGEILTGLKIPNQCTLYKTVCTPMDPIGPCMVSSEGTCAAFYRYQGE